MVLRLVLLFCLSLQFCQGEKKFTFDDIYTTKKKSFSVQWSGTEEGFTYRKDGASVYVNAADQKETEVFSKDELKDYGSVLLNAKRNAFIGGQEIKQKWRHSTIAKYFVQEKGKDKVPIHNEELEFAGWSPKGEAISYVHKKNLYVTKEPADSTKSIAITKDGADDLYNGIPDWLYEEEILSDRVSHYWSQDDNKICYSVIDDKNIWRQSWLVYGDKNNVNETLKQIPYPKAGIPKALTSKVQLKVASIDWTTNTVGTTITLQPPDSLKNVDHYFLQVKWINNNKIFVTWANRIQTKATHVFYDLGALDMDVFPTEIFQEDTQEKGWINVPPTRPIFTNNDENTLITTKPHKATSGKVWNHLVKYTKEAQKYKEEFLLESEAEVSQLLRADQNFVYFIQTDGSSRTRKLYKLDLKDKKVEEMKTGCSYLSASFSSTGEYYFKSCLGPDVPSYTLASTKEGYTEKVYEDNNELKEKLKEDDLVKEYINEDGVYIELYRPKGTEDQKLPLLVYCYAGPGTQEVSEKYDWGSNTMNWLLHIAFTFNVAVASIDGRGTLGNGEEFKHALYKKMGVYEIEDQIKGIKILAKRDTIDEKSVSIFGWSYGGFTAANVLASDNVAKCGLSVAPVTNKALYDTAYTERYLGLFDNNAAAYNQTNLQNKASNFQGKNFLVAHGTADDNVHFVNFAHLIKELELNQVIFTQLTYPDEAHGISNTLLNKHLFHSLTQFIQDKCLPEAEDRSSASILTANIVFIVTFVAAKLI